MNKDRKSQYIEKLKDPRWQKKRLEIFNRDKWACHSCSDFKSTLAVHHRYYINNRDPWDYPSDSLVTLCESCHSLESESIPEQIELLSQAVKEKFLSADIERIAIAIHMMDLQHSPEIVSCAFALAFESAEIQRELIDKFFSLEKDKRK